MKLTKALKAWLIENCGVDADANDDEFRKAAGTAFADGTLTAEEYGELSAPSGADEVNEFSTKLNQVADGLDKLVGLLTKTVEPETKTDDEPKPVKAVTQPKPSRLAKMFAGSYDGDDDKDVDIRVKEAADSYSKTKTAMTYPAETKAGRAHPFAGQPVMDYGTDGRVLDNPSDLEKAVVGAYGKFLCALAQKHSRNLAWMSLPGHDRELILHAMQNMPWCGASDGGDYADIVRRNLTPHEQKAIIDDSVSGGIEAVPLPFDDMIVSTPILNGEFAPLVNTVPLDKGRRIQGARAGTVTGSWGGIDDTAITLFDTTSYISAFDTTIYRWQGAIWVGLDFLSDTPIDFAQFLTQQYGEVLLQDLDTVICVGNGTTQPEGVMTKSGTTSVAWGGSTTIGNYESLLFGVHKRELAPNMARTAVFGGTFTSYQRAKAIPVGASDARRLSQTVTMPDYRDYSWMGHPYKINESMTNAQIFFAVLGRYRMYRRRGLTMRTSTEGDTLIRRNELLLTATARYGGQLERGAAAAVTNTAPA